MTGRVCSLQLMLALASEVILGYKSCRTYDHIFLPQIRDFQNLKILVPVHTSLGNRMAQLYAGTGFPYESQGYGGGIRSNPQEENHSSST
jgi:hypothetical protein